MGRTDVEPLFAKITKKEEGKKRENIMRGRDGRKNTIPKVAKNK